MDFISSIFSSFHRTLVTMNEYPLVINVRPFFPFKKPLVDIGNSDKHLLGNDFVRMNIGMVNTYQTPVRVFQLLKRGASLRVKQFKNFFVSENGCHKKPVNKPWQQK